MQALSRPAGIAILVALVGALGLTGLVRADRATAREDRSAIEERIERQKQRMEENKESLSELSQKEEKLYSELAELKERVERLTTRMSEQEKNLRRKRRRRKELHDRNKELLRRTREKEEAVRDMLSRLWPLYVKSRELGPGQVLNLQNIRLNYAWLTSIYEMARDHLASLQAEQKELNTNLSRLKQVEKSISKRLREIQDTKDELLEQRLTYQNKLQEVRAQRLAKREQLEQIRETIEDLRYRLENAKKEISRLKGSLTWPASGRVVDTEEGEAGSSKGLSFSLSEGQKVRSVAWGKVVYDDKLRGFGQVVIILHGQDYYSLYAYLLSSRVKMGQKIDQGETIGRAGFHPRVNGPGLYFELRRGQQPIDPKPWLEAAGGRG